MIEIKAKVLAKVWFPTGIKDDSSEVASLALRVQTKDTIVLVRPANTSIYDEMVDIKTGTSVMFIGQVLGRDFIVYKIL